MEIRWIFDGDSKEIRWCFDGRTPGLQITKTASFRNIFDTLCFSFRSEDPTKLPKSFLGGPRRSLAKILALRGLHFESFSNMPKCENQAETAARTLFSTFGKVQHQAQNQIRNREPPKMTLSEARELYEALRVMKRRHRGPQKGPKVEVFGSF